MPTRHRQHVHGKVVFHAAAPPYVPAVSPTASLNTADVSAITSTIESDTAPKTAEEYYYDVGGDSSGATNRERKMMSQNRITRKFVMIPHARDVTTPPRGRCHNDVQHALYRGRGADAELRYLQSAFKSGLEDENANEIAIPRAVATQQYMINGERVWFTNRGRDALVSANDMNIGGTMMGMSKNDCRDVRRAQDKIRDSRRQRARDAKLSAADFGMALLGQALALESSER